jgi:hypothetical protein
MKKWIYDKQIIAKAPMEIKPDDVLLYFNQNNDGERGLFFDQALFNNCISNSLNNTPDKVYKCMISELLKNKKDKSNNYFNLNNNTNIIQNNEFIKRMVEMPQRIRDYTLRVK